MKKVLFTATVDSHIKHFHLPYLKHFKEKGYEVHVATNGLEDIEYCDVKHVIPFERSPLKINNLKAIKQLKKIINEEKFDIIHCHTPMGGVVTRIAAMKARKKYGTKVIYTAHGFHFYKGAPLQNWIIFYPIEKCLSKYTDCLITINKEDYELAKKKFKSNRIELVYGVGVNQNRFKIDMTDEEKKELKNSIGINENDFVMIIVGELNKNKNQLLALNAMKELIKNNPNIKLILVGKGALEGYYKDIIKENNLGEYVKILGYRTDIPQLLKISDVLLSLSFREGLPVNVMEAMTSGLPIIATNCRGNRDLVQDGVNGYIINIDDRVELIASIIKAYKHNDKLNKDGEFTKNYIQEILLDNISNKMKEIYNTLKSFDQNKKIDIISKEIGKKSPIRVLHVVGSMNMGGAENFIMNLYRNIDRDKIQFDFISHKPGIFDDEIESLGGKIYYLKYITDVGPFKYKKELKNFLLKHKSEYKVLHSHVDQTSGIILEIARKCGIKTTFSHSHSTGNSNNIVTKIYKRYLQLKINKNATCKFACSEVAGNWLYRNTDYEIVNNGIDIERFIYSEENCKKIRNELNIPLSSTVIGHVGRFDEVKNHKMLIDIFYSYHLENKDSYLILVGDGVLKNNIEKKVEELNIKEYVKFLGIRKDTAEIYSAMDIFVFPSFFEGFPVTLVEVAANGLNVLASNRISEEVNINNNIKFLDINNIDNWLAELKNIKKERKKINSDNLLNFDINKISKRYEKKVEEEVNN